MRIFKTSVFARWANKNQVTNADLRQAIKEIEAGLVDAELGAGLCKKRIPMAGAAESVVVADASWLSAHVGGRISYTVLRRALALT